DDLSSPDPSTTHPEQQSTHATAPADSSIILACKLWPITTYPPHAQNIHRPWL
ncbi:hypothetical protein KCU77_g16454, partial [Aureobasidium melanogenum]